MKNVKIDSLQPLVVDVPNFQRFMGRYYLTGLVTKPDSTGQPCWAITLSDGSGDLKVFCNNSELMACNFQPNTLVHVEAVLQQKHGSAHYRCKNLVPVANTHTIGRDLSALPRSLCPLPIAFDALIFLAGRIENPILRQFLRNVLLKPQIGVRYLQCPASLKYHHNFPGGLIHHSVEIAWDIFGVQDFRPIERDIAVVAALLHDIGKVYTLTPDMTRTAIGSLVDHNQLTLEICAEPLAELDAAAPHIANQLRHAWTCYSPGSRYGFKPKTRVANYLQKSDKSSSERKTGSWPVPDFGDVTDFLRTGTTN